MRRHGTEPLQYRAYTKQNIQSLPQFRRMRPDQRAAVEAVSSVLPFRVNNYVVDQLIDWDNLPADPIFQLTFPQEEMLAPKDFARIRNLLDHDVKREELARAALQIRRGLNPHPAGQLELNVPRIDGEPVPGIQHKYRETVLFFPGHGQTCHAYCTYCFRWPQFVGMDELKFASAEASSLVDYLRSHTEVSDVLITGGDPMIMKTAVLESYIEPLLHVESVRSIRIGTKALAWWPYRFVTDPDAESLLRLFGRVVDSEKHLALMAHYSHPRELSTPISRLAVQRVRQTGAVIRAQAPVIRHVNDNADVWASMWQQQVDQGIIPYYMFVERDTGPRHYFEVPLFRTLEMFTRAVRQVSGLGRTVRGPSMSCTPGKVLIDGTAEVDGQQVFVLKFIQGRDPAWTNRIFFAEYDRDAHWIDDLKPAYGDTFFFDEAPQEGRKWKHLTIYPGAGTGTR